MTVAAGFWPIPEGVTDALVVLGILVVVGGGRLIRSLLVHQQRMAEIIHKNQSMGLQPTSGQVNDPRIDSIRNDVELLKATVNQQTLLLDTIATQQKQMLEAISQKDLSQRLTSGGD